MAGLGAPELLIVLTIILLVFGGSKLPQLARSLGSAKREFEHGSLAHAPAQEARRDASLGEPVAEHPPLGIARAEASGTPGDVPDGEASRRVGTHEQLRPDAG